MAVLAARSAEQQPEVGFDRAVRGQGPASQPSPAKPGEPSRGKGRGAGHVTMLSAMSLFSVLSRSGEQGEVGTRSGLHRDRHSPHLGTEHPRSQPPAARPPANAQPTIVQLHLRLTPAYWSRRSSVLLPSSGFASPGLVAAGAAQSPLATMPCFCSRHETYPPTHRSAKKEAALGRPFARRARELTPYLDRVHMTGYLTELRYGTVACGRTVDSQREKVGCAGQELMNSRMVWAVPDHDVCSIQTGRSRLFEVFDFYLLYRVF
ncbi:hypothetical protein GGR56DRAFT_183493 [Xylariaceae sp. FL0804]|nr:hypothetical protein GGR56DRAFT_183493 [Xylariaceae sp. FL0804]